MAYYKIRPRGGTTPQWEKANTVLSEREIAFEYTGNAVGKGLVKMKMGDGITPWNDLPYAIMDGMNESQILEIINNSEVLQELKKSVANGKTLIGGVVGGDQNSTFAVLANNAQNIKTARDEYLKQVENLQVELRESNKLASDLNFQVDNLTKDRDNWKNQANIYLARLNDGIKTIVGKVDSYQVLSSSSTVVGSDTTYGTNCGKDTTGYYYDITLNTRFTDLTKVKLIIRMTGQIDYYNGVSGSGGTIRNATTVPKGILYNNAGGNTILRLYQNYQETAVSSGVGTWNYYYIKYVEYNILYI